MSKTDRPSEQININIYNGTPQININPKKSTISQNNSTSDKKNAMGTFPTNNLPFIKNYYFTSRANILEVIHENFGVKSTTPVFQIITGMGGVGKTQIALEYAYKHITDYQLIWWINAESEMAMVRDYLSLGETFGLTELIDTNDVKLGTERFLAKTFIEISKVGKCLLIIDNADKNSDLEKFLPKSIHVSVLITTRKQKWNFGRIIPIDVFTPEESVLFLINRTSISDKTSASILSTHLGYLPLALEQAAAYITNNSIDFSVYIELFEHHRLKLFSLPSSSATNYQHTVMITWLISISKIDNNLSSKLLKYLAYLDPVIATTTMFIEGYDYLDKSIGCNNAEIVINEAIFELTNYSLIKKEGNKLSIHRLLQEVIRHGSSPADARSVLDFISGLFVKMNPLIGQDKNNTVSSTRKQDYQIRSSDKYSWEIFDQLSINLVSVLDNTNDDIIKFTDTNIRSIARFIEGYIFNEVSANSFGGSIIITYIKGFYNVCSRICRTSSDLEYFEHIFLMIYTENRYRSNYINNAIKDYAEPLLLFLDQCDDSIETAYYLIVVSLSGRLSCCYPDKFWSRIERAQKIYESLDMLDAAAFTMKDLYNENNYFPFTPHIQKILKGEQPEE